MNFPRNPILADGIAVLVGAGLLFAGYATAFAASLDQPLLRSVTFAAINTLGACAASLIFHPLLAGFLVKRSWPLVIVLHPFLAAAFAIVWYLCTLTGFAITPAWMNHRGLRAAPFEIGALSWQMFQGVTLYAVLALFIYWRHARSELAQQRQTLSHEPVEPATKAVATATTGSLLIRCEKEVVPVSPADLIRITGADGYSEVVTRTRRILSTTSLARFAEILPADQFVRAHRSHIIRLGAVRHAEPAGNARLLLHLEDGMRIMTSRSGAKRLRELTV